LSSPVWPIKRPPDMTIAVMLHNTDPRCIPSQRVQWLIDHGYAQVDKASGLVHIIDRSIDGKSFKQMILFRPQHFPDDRPRSHASDDYPVVSSHHIPLDGSDPDGDRERRRRPAMVRKYIESSQLAIKGGVDWAVDGPALIDQAITTPPEQQSGPLAAAQG